MLSSALSALTERVDSKFLTAYWLPAFVAGLGWLGMLAALAGPGQMDNWVNDLDSVEQSLAVLILLLMVTMLAFVFRALTRTIAETFAGAFLPRVVAAWSRRGQLAIKHQTEHLLNVSPDDPASLPSASQSTVMLNRVFPHDD